ncbi:hypothetical protein E2I00_006278, partial [Balaenoptera physalus]
LPMAFDDVALYFLEQEWEVLEKWQKEMYQQEMKTNYETLDSLGCISSKPDLITWMEQGRMLLIRDQGHLEKTQMTLGLSGRFTKSWGQRESLSHVVSDVKTVLDPADPSLMRVGLFVSPGDQGTLRAKEEECHLNGLQEQGFCAPLSKEERKILSDQRAALQHPSLQETEILNKNLDITASHQDKNDPRHKPMGTPDHLEIPPGLRLYSCFVCRRVFQIKRDFVKHKRNHRESQSCQYPKHKNKSRGKAELRWPRPVPRKQQPFRRGAREQSGCVRGSLALPQVARPGPECGRPFWSKATLNKHVCSPKGERPFSCRECGRGFTQQDELAEHLRVHSGRTPFQGPQGGRGPSGEAAARAHGRAHRGEKPFSCDNCDRKFTHRSKLTEHRQEALPVPRVRPELLLEERHEGAPASAQPGEALLLRARSGRKPFPCATCGRSFAQRYRLTEHVRVHSGEKPFRGEKPFGCPECGKSFLQKRSLETHLHRHRGERPFSCADDSSAVGPVALLALAEAGQKTHPTCFSHTGQHGAGGREGCLTKVPDKPGTASRDWRKAGFL